MKKDKALSIIRRPNLTKGQKDLYDLIVLKLDSNQMIMFAEAKEIWLNKVCKQVYDGVPHYWNYYHHQDENNEWHAGYSPMTEKQITERILLWLTANIGALVLKGYLKVIPMIEIKQII